MLITAREQAILFAIVEAYAELATPVGSVTLAKLFKVSPATIRSEMVKLERMGFLSQPYTSAGRVPTDAGYRLYVNSLAFNTPKAEKPANAKDKKESQKHSDRATRALATRIESQTRADFAIRIAVDSLVQLTGNLGIGTIGDQVYLAGLSHLFSQPEFNDVAKVQAVARMLDDIQPWLREASLDHAINVYIGTENPIGKSSHASLILSRFRSPLSNESYIGVLGPTRQPYRRVMALVRQAGLMLEDILYAYKQD